ncbi:MAG: hypothetical protein CVU70_01345 [Deltaproteobacteria bacterium HGW-Deltaproteobacteria-5]|jgi:hypothetical protein|nr:MAG: hypothetical protein CVU70_01345 [Deltaproteobacteria bacterium HGW-Deltaproteobacteria-5]
MRAKLTIIFTLALLLLLSLPVEAKHIFMAGRDVTVEQGQTVENVAVVGGQATINGLVEQNVIVVGGSAVLTNNAVVRGNVIVVGGIVVKGSGSLIFGDVTEVNSTTLADSINAAMRGELEGWSLILNVISLCFFAIILIIALIMALLMPRSLDAVVNTIRTYTLKSFFWGFLATLMIVPFFMLLAISVIGILLIPLAFTALLLAAIIGFTAFGSLLGNIIITKIFRGYQKSIVKETLVGLCLLWLLGWIPFCIGMLIKTLAITFGLGGVVLALTSRKTRQ